jgi:hypothetical protein
VKVNPQDGAAVQMVPRIEALFLVDRHARQQHMSVEDRLALRREHAESWAEEIRRECVAVAKTALPKSALGQAVSYTLNMWMKLRRCFDYAEVELSNNLVENSMRPIALGRKNWLHVGRAPAGPKVAAILSGGGIVPQNRRARDGLSNECAARYVSTETVGGRPFNSRPLVGIPALTLPGLA